MLAKKYRLPIQTVKNKPSRQRRGQYFSFKLFNNKLPYWRAGVIISKSVFNSAAKRNWLKRIILEYWRRPPAPKPSQDILIIVLPAAKNLKTKDAIIEELAKELHENNF